MSSEEDNYYLFALWVHEVYYMNDTSEIMELPDTFLTVGHDLWKGREDYQNDCRDSAVPSLKNVYR